MITALYYALPGLVANMMPILVKNHFRFLDVPIDFNIKLGKKPLLGTHKTLRGFIFGVIGAIIIAYFQKLLYMRGLFHTISYIDYSTSFIIIGTVMGLGALVGDSARSFIKRRLNVREGARFFPWDQVDYTIGIAVFAMLLRPMSLWMILELVLVGIVLHVLCTRIGFYAGLRKEKW